MQIPLFFLVSTLFCVHVEARSVGKYAERDTINPYIKTVQDLTLDAAYALTNRARHTADSLHHNVTVVILDASGEILMVTRGKGVGPHNTEAARREAYTSLSTKTATLLLMRNTKANPDAQNLNTLPELLLLSGGVPLWYRGNVVGSIGVAGGGSAQNDDLIANSVSILDSEISTTN
ncbi:MAG TPA: heme-binding protein [Hanamia sp.]